MYALTVVAGLLYYTGLYVYVKAEISCHLWFNLTGLQTSCLSIFILMQARMVFKDVLHPEHTLISRYFSQAELLAEKEIPF